MSTRKRKLKRPYRILRGLYRTVVALSSIVVVFYLAMTFALREPEMAQAIDLPGGQSESSPEIIQAGTKVRKDRCYTFLIAASDDGNGNADTIILVTYDVPNQKIGMVSIPRDTIVTTDRTNSPKINAGYGRGIENLIKEVTNLIGYPIDFYIEIDLEGFVALVDTVGEIEFDVPVEMYYDDPVADLHIHFMPGVQTLNGQQALEVVRFRQNADMTGYPDSDIGRTKTQQQMLSVLAKKILSWNNIANVNQFINIFATYVDTNMSTLDMLYFASKAISLDVDSSLSMATLPGDGTKRYKGFPWCYELFEEESLEILNNLVNPYTVPLTLEDVDFVRADN